MSRIPLSWWCSVATLLILIATFALPWTSTVAEHHARSLQVYADPRPGAGRFDKDFVLEQLARSTEQRPASALANQASGSRGGEMWAHAIRALGSWGDPVTGAKNPRFPESTRARAESARWMAEQGARNDPNNGFFPLIGAFASMHLGEWKSAYELWLSASQRERFDDYGSDLLERYLRQLKKDTFEPLPSQVATATGSVMYPTAASMRIPSNWTSKLPSTAAQLQFVMATDRVCRLVERSEMPLIYRLMSRQWQLAAVAGRAVRSQEAWNQEEFTKGLDRWAQMAPSDSVRKQVESIRWIGLPPRTEGPWPPEPGTLPARTLVALSAVVLLAGILALGSYEAADASVVLRFAFVLAVAGMMGALTQGSLVGIAIVIGMPLAFAVYFLGRLPGHRRATWVLGIVAIGLIVWAGLGTAKPLSFWQPVGLWAIIFALGFLIRGAAPRWVVTVGAVVLMGWLLWIFLRSPQSSGGVQQQAAGLLQFVGFVCGLAFPMLLAAASAVTKQNLTDTIRSALPAFPVVALGLAGVFAITVMQHVQLEREWADGLEVLSREARIGEALRRAGLGQE